MRERSRVVCETIPGISMSNLLVLCAFTAFALFLIAREQKFAAITGWACMMLNLWSEIPALLAENNFLYPARALLSLPFLAISAERLLREDTAVLQLSRTAAIATIIYLPFTLVPFLNEALISLVITLAFGLITSLGHHPVMLAWDVMTENSFSNQIILACTGITAIALMLGIAFGERTLSRMQAVLAFLLVVPLLFLLNLVRVVVLFISVSDAWFGAWYDPTGTGDANFFWVHNVLAEGLGILFLLALTWLLVRMIPPLGTFARNLIKAYRDSLLSFLRSKPIH